jgi:hypothetical protein
MEVLLRPLFAVLECPNIKLKKPNWLKAPSAMTVFAFLIVTYFLVTGGKKLKSPNKKLSRIKIKKFLHLIGVIYDVIVEPPSVGSTTGKISLYFVIFNFEIN